METQYINLNMTPTGVTPTFHISQYDVGRMLGFIVHSGGATVDLDTYTCTIEATRSDGTAITSAVATTDNIGTFEVTPTMSNKADKYKCQLVIVDANSKRIASLPFDMDVCKAAMDENAESIEEDVSLYQQYTEAVQGAIAEANADIQAEENARIAAVNAEATARANANAALQNNINSEASTRAAADNTLQDNINSEASTRAAADAVLQGQIDNFVQLPSGSTAADAELVNIRVKADGTSAATAGNAVREQFTELKNDLDNALNQIGVVTTVSPNLLNPEEIEAGRITSSSSVVLHTGSYDTDYVTTGFIPVEEGKKYGFHIKNGVNIVGVPTSNIWAYDSSKAGLSYLGNVGYNADGLSYITAPTGCKYVRASLSTANYNLSPPIMFSEVDGTSAPSEIYPYGTEYKLTGFVDDETFGNTVHDIENIQAIIDNNFVPEWGATEGTVTEGKFIESNGVVTDITGNYAIRTLPVTPYEKYKISAKAYYGKYYYAFYDEENTFISGHVSTETGTTYITDELVTAPANASTLVVCGHTNGTNAVIKIITGYVISDKYPWLNKKWVVVGDSLTQLNEATSIHYFDYIADDSGITPYNMGVGGTGYCRGYDSNRAFYQRISSVPTDADVVTVFGSGNDMNIAAMPIFDGKTWAEALGTFSDNGTDTICGCVNTFLDNYFAVMPTVPIGIIAPTPWMSYPTTLLSNNRFEEYTAALKQIADYRGVPFLDLYHHSNLRPENEANRNACFYGGASLDGNGDGVHPNELGHKIIASKIYEFVKTMLLD